MNKKILFVIVDGLPDGKDVDTSLQNSRKEFLDFYAKNGYSGLVENHLAEHPDSSISNFVLLGYDKGDFPGRGYLEALGVGLKPNTEEICMRGNFATVESMIGEKTEGQFVPQLKIKDRRAGREVDGLSDIGKSIASMNIEAMWVKCHRSLGHRCVVTVSSATASENITDSDPFKVGVPPAEIKPTASDNNAAKTAAVLNKWSYEIHKIMKDQKANKYRKFPANYVLLRGASKYRYVKSFKELNGLKTAMVAAAPILKGIGRAADMEIIDVPSATGNEKTNLKEKTLSALNALYNNDMVIMHIKGTDTLSHDKMKAKKIRFIEQIDNEVFKRIFEYVDFSKTVLVVAADHPTSLETGEHVKGDIPFIIFTKGIESTPVQKYDEKSCKLGPTITIDSFMEKVLSYR